MAIKYTNIFQKNGFLVCKQTIWQPLLERQVDPHAFQRISHANVGRVLGWGQPCNVTLNSFTKLSFERILSMPFVLLITGTRDF
jgi:hypothetical protein